MKRVKNLTERKGLINTFKRFKTKNHIFKSSLKKKYFTLSKVRQQIQANRKIFYFSRVLNILFFKPMVHLEIKTKSAYNIQSKFPFKFGIKTLQFKKILMLINLYFYQNTQPSYTHTTV